MVDKQTEFIQEFSNDELEDQIAASYYGIHKGHNIEFYEGILVKLWAVFDSRVLSKEIVTA